MTEAAPPAIMTEPVSRDAAGWWLVAAVALCVALFQAWEPFQFAGRPLLLAGLFWAALAAAGRFYTHVRPRPQFVAMFDSLLQMLVFSALGASLSYMVAAQGGVYWDETLRAWDAALGLDWLAYVGWVNDNPLIALLYRIAYISLIPQMVAMILVLGFMGKVHALRVAVFAAMLAGVVTILLSGLTPALSNFVALGIKPSDFPMLDPAAAWVHVADLEGLRAGTLRMIAIDRVEGIVTFPSYHAALATVFAWGFLKAPWVRWVGFGWAMLTILATPVDGAHYFVDVFAGIAIAGVAIAVAHTLVPMRLRLPLATPGQANPASA